MPATAGGTTRPTTSEDNNMSIAREFREFAMRGNVVDMAVGIVIGAAFGRIVSSLVENVVMPPVGLLIGGVDFSDLAITLKQAQGDVEAVTIGYGQFIQSVLDFVIIAAAIFLVIRAMNTMKRKQAEAPAEPAATPADVTLLTEIRDLLRERKA